MDDIQLFANFCSGNMAKYERVVNKITTPPDNQQTKESSSESAATGDANSTNNKRTGQDPPLFQQKIDVEFNIWTKADCEGEAVGANGNRTWFYFGVKGGHGKWLKFNLMNLNKQGKLFEMGMLPVFKTVPSLNSKWSRIYSKPNWQTVNNLNFQLSFTHRIPEKRETTTYFAFCYPHSYEECQEMLEKLDKQFENCKTINSNSRCDPDMIYYHRELFCYSLDKRRIDLITISACNQMNTTKREPRFDPDNLFPKNNDQRCFEFDQKRVFVLSSRVHPGETPASFVFNGFLEFILRKDDVRARALRQKFVFKLIPMLNPDGVAVSH
jgi:cytosolic carboxypeptidase protein 5